jgi:protein SCO1
MAAQSIETVPPRETWDNRPMSEAPRASPYTRRQLLAGGAALAAATVAGVLTARRLSRRHAAVPTTRVALVYPAPRPLPPFSLLAHDGSSFDAARLRGHYTFVLFGYTNCPDVCPTTLMELARARQRLADLPAAARPAVALVSVDPARDTPERLAAYAPHFDPSFVGVTGSEAAIGALAQALGVAIERGTPVDGSYSVDHTAAIFLIDPAARVAAVFPAPHEAAALADDYRAIRAAAGGG